MKMPAACASMLRRRIAGTPHANIHQLGGQILKGGCGAWILGVKKSLLWFALMPLPLLPAEDPPVDTDMVTIKSDTLRGAGLEESGGKMPWKEPELWLGGAAMILDQGELQKFIDLKMDRFPLGGPAMSGTLSGGGGERFARSGAAFGLAVEASLSKEGPLRWFFRGGWLRQPLLGGNRTVLSSGGESLYMGVSSQVDLFPGFVGVRLPLREGNISLSPYIGFGAVLAHVNIAETWTFSSPSPGAGRDVSTNASYQSWAATVTAGAEWCLHLGRWRLVLAGGYQMGRAEAPLALENYDSNGDGARDVAKGQAMIYPGQASGPWVELSGFDIRAGLGASF